MSSRALFTAVLLLAVVAAILPVGAQQAPKIPTIGLITSSTPAGIAHLVAAFRQGLRELGYVEGVVGRSLGGRQRENAQARSLQRSLASVEQ
jgi:hypothetical protein